MSYLRKYMQAMTTHIKVGNSSLLLPYADDNIKIRESFDDRVMVYRNSSFSSLHGALSSNYLSVVELVGEEFFLQLAADFFDTYQQKDRCLVDVGKHFPSFIKDQYKHHKLPYLYDIAMLDRGWLVSHLAQEYEPISEGQIESLMEKEFDEWELFVHPSLVLYKTQWDVFDIWSKLKQEKEINKIEQIKQCDIYVFSARPQRFVTYNSISKSEYNFLKCLKEEKDFSKAVTITFKDNQENKSFEIEKILFECLDYELLCLN